MKIVINTCYGGFALSQKAYVFLGLTWDDYGFAFSDDRTNPKLIQAVETLGKDASGKYSLLKVVDIPDDIEFTIENYDGLEWIAEKHRIL